jgi:CheY-like chemotaxis protein
MIHRGDALSGVNIRIGLQSEAIELAEGTIETVLALLERPDFIAHYGNHRGAKWGKSGATSVYRTNMALRDPTLFTISLKQPRIGSHPDLILSDYTLPQFDGMSALSLARERAPTTPFLIVTGSVNEETAVNPAPRVAPAVDQDHVCVGDVEHRYDHAERRRRERIAMTDGLERDRDRGGYCRRLEHVLADQRRGECQRRTGQQQQCECEQRTDNPDRQVQVSKRQQPVDE